MSNWKRKKQETTGDYFFNGTFYVTQSVYSSLSPNETLSIYLDIQMFAKEQNGIDYLQVFEDEKGRKLFVIDQLSKSMIKERIVNQEYNPEDNYCTIMFASEY
jgi:hypothetical protein